MLTTKRPRTVVAAGGRPHLRRRCDMPQAICSIEGCERASRARGWCNAHWKRWQRHGDPLGGGTAVGEGGYGSIHSWVNRHFPRLNRCDNCARRGPTEYASISHTYRRDRGDWFELCPQCHKAFDGFSGALASIAQRRAKTHCKHGHRFDEANTEIRANGSRRCRKCSNERAKLYQRRRRESGA